MFFALQALLQGFFYPKASGNFPDPAGGFFPKRGKFFSHFPLFYATIKEKQREDDSNVQS